MAEFFRHLSQPEVIGQVASRDTGFLPITVAAFERVKGVRVLSEEPGRGHPVPPADAQAPTENSRGLRLGNMPEIRNIIQEEMEKALQGQQSAQQALDTAVQRGNVVLRSFERANR